jgi:hypothetical protein
MVAKLGEHAGGLACLCKLCLGLRERPVDFSKEARGFGEPKDVVEAVFLAPGHERFAAEARVRPQRDLDRWLLRAQVAHKARHLFQSPRTRGAVGRTPPSAQ